MPNRLRKPCLALIIVSAALWPMAAAHAQASSNPNINAQLLIAARQADVGRADRLLADGAV
ncbi:MAG: hypothetical protein ACXWJ1_12115, partial [Caldimonas sp.]